MADADPPADLNQPECREPTLEDLVKLCRILNGLGAKYIVVGGFAIRAAGYSRTTMDVDLVVETGVENEARVIKGLMSLPDQSVREIKPGEVEEFGVVRVADEILVDLMKSGCGVNYADAIRDAIYHEVDGVRIPFASPRKASLWKKSLCHRVKLWAAGSTADSAAVSESPGTTGRDWRLRISSPSILLTPSI